MHRDAVGPLALLHALQSDVNARETTASGIIHDINNLLMIIHFASHQLLDCIPVEDPNRAVVNAIQDARRQATELAKTLSVISETKKQTPCTTDLNRIIEHYGKQCECLFRETVVTTFKFCPGRAHVTVDPAMLNLVVLNLMLCSFTSVRNGGWVTIETAIVESTISDSHQPARGSHVRLTITDTGLTPQEFGAGESGAMSDTSSLTDFVNEVLNPFGGSLEKHQSLETGTSVHLSIPLAIESRSEATECVPQRAFGQKPMILLVDDEELVRGYISQILASSGYSVVTARDASGACDTFGRNSNIEVVITDVMLSGSSGYHLVEQLRTSIPDLPAIFISGLTIDLADAIHRSNANTFFLQKPFEASDLLTLLGRCIRNGTESS